MRALAAILALSLLVAPALVGSAGAPPSAAWRAKADAKLLAAADAGTGTALVMVQGAPIPPPSPAPATRDGWNQYWAQRSAPFFQQVRGQAAQLGGEVYATLPAVNAAHVRLPASRIPDLVAASSVQVAGLDYDGATHVLDTGPGTDATLASTAQLLQVDQLWALGYHGEGVKVAMVDTGLRPTHEMFRNADGTTRVAQWFDATTDPNGTGYCATPCDANGHGTHTGSTMGGSNLYNSGSPKGMAPAVTLMAERIFQGSSGQWSWAQKGLQAAFDAGADVTSNSWGGPCSDADGVATARLAENLTKAGMISVFAAGNSGPGSGTINCPGAADLVVTVGAVDSSKNVASFSSRGPCTWPTDGSGTPRVCPDIMAVGVDVTAAWNSCDTCYATESGTSMATPHVAGIVALLEQAHRALAGSSLDAPRKQAEILLRYSALDLGAAGPDDDYGWGLAQAKDAYALLASPQAVDLRSVWSPGPGVVHAGQAAPLDFDLANLGTATLTGTFTHTLEQVDGGGCPGACETVTIASGPLTLGPLEEKLSEYSFQGWAHAAGLYAVAGEFDYTYTDAGGAQHSGSLARSGTLLLKKVDFAWARAVPDVSHTGDLIHAGMQLRNRGNENASSVQFNEVFTAEGFAPVPLVPPGSGLPFGLVADPAPGVKWLSVYPTTVQYTFDAGSILQGSTWTARYDFLAGAPGSYRFDGWLTYHDETGQSFGADLGATKAVALPG